MKKLRHSVDTQGYLPKDSEPISEFPRCANFFFNKKLTTFMKYMFWTEDSEKKVLLGTQKSIDYVNNNNYKHDGEDEIMPAA